MDQSPAAPPTSASPNPFEAIRASLYAGALSDVLDEMGYRNQVVDPKAAIRPLRPDSVLFGRACTLRNSLDARVEDPYALAMEAMDQMQPGDVLIAAGDQPLDVGIFGELSAARVTSRGGRGALIDGFTRDGRKLLETGFPVFCKGISPIDTTGRVRVVAYNVPLALGGLTVQPGQLVFADLDGIVLIPKEAEDDVLARALERVEVESNVRRELNAGASLNEVWQKYHVL